jgi:hypothetical protein
MKTQHLRLSSNAFAALFLLIPFFAPLPVNADPVGTCRTVAVVQAIMQKVQYPHATHDVKNVSVKNSTCYYELTGQAKSCQWPMAKAEYITAELLAIIKGANKSLGIIQNMLQSGAVQYCRSK